MTEVFFTGCPEDDEHRYGHALARYALKKVFGDDLTQSERLRRRGLR